MRDYSADNQQNGSFQLNFDEWITWITKQAIKCENICNNRVNKNNKQSANTSTTCWESSTAKPAEFNNNKNTICAALVSWITFMNRTSTRSRTDTDGSLGNLLAGYGRYENSCALNVCVNKHTKIIKTCLWWIHNVMHTQLIKMRLV